MNPPRATLVLPVKDGAADLPAVLASLAAQQLEGGLEVVAIDSGSKDASVSLLEAAGVRLLRIAPQAFDHGETRNLGVRESRGGIVLFLSQDACPADSGFARRLVEALEADSRLAGAFARQLPRPEADPMTRRDLQSWVASRPEPRVMFADAARMESLPPLLRYYTAAFDNVASAARRALLLAHPFAATRFGEDVEWGARMLERGHGLAYVPEAVVVHSHARTAAGLYRRNYLGHRTLARLFGLRTIPDRPHLMRAALASLFSDLRTLLKEGAGLRTWLGMPGCAIAGAYGQYRGARDEMLSRPWPEWSAPGRA